MKINVHIRTIIVVILKLHFLQNHCISGKPNLKDDNNSFYKYFIKEAPLHPMDNFLSIDVKDIPWVDQNLLEKAKIFYNRNYIGVSMAHLYSFLESFSLKTMSSVKILTDDYSNTTVIYKRILQTFFHSSMWMKAGSEIFQQNSSAYKSLQQVRQSHKLVAEKTKTNRSLDYISAKVPLNPSSDITKLTNALKDDLAHVDTSKAPKLLSSWDYGVSFSQFDLGVAQFWFLGHIILWPKAFGIENESAENSTAFIHLWACVGRIMGIQDRFNVALNLPRQMYKQFYTNIIVCSLKVVDERVVYMMDSYMKVFGENFMIPVMGRIKCWFYYVLPLTVEGFTGKHLRKIMDEDDRLCLRFIEKEVGPPEFRRINTISGTLLFNYWLDVELDKMQIMPVNS